jgi:hypothetical protein
MSTPRRPPPWIPPFGLVAGHIAHGFSWIALLTIGMQGELPDGFRGLAWVHLVGLAWITVVALSVLIHVIPQFCDVHWRGERLARVSIVALAIGAYGLAAGFWVGSPKFLMWSALVVGGSLAAYLGAAFTTLVTIHADRVTRAVGRALGVVLTMLAAAAVVGVIMAIALVDGPGVVVLNIGPAIHAHLAAVGWISLLIMGVSMRTLGPIAGRRPASASTHKITGSFSVAGLLLLVFGLIVRSAWPSWVGAGVIGVAFALYLIELGAVLRSATESHRPPQAFLGAAGVWLALATILGLGVLAGLPFRAAYTFVGLMGWAGQMVLGHLHHIGLRLLATTVRGEHDETEPRELLLLPLTWLTFALFQLAIGCGVAGLLADSSLLVTAAGSIGLCAWLTMSANVIGAWRRAHPVM